MKVLHFKIKILIRLFFQIPYEHLKEINFVLAFSQSYIQSFFKFPLNLTFRAEEDSKKWEAYLTFIDNLVIDGLLQAVASSLGFFLDETDPTLTQGILFEVS